MKLKRRRRGSNNKEPSTLGLAVGVGRVDKITERKDVAIIMRWF
jgi:hypothetical protein